MRLIFFSIFSLAGLAVLLGLGTWQMQRLAWKQEILDTIDSRIVSAPVDLPATILPETDKYLPVQATGSIGPSAIRVLTSRKSVGAGYRLISPFQTGGRLILLDRGFLPQAKSAQIDFDAPVTVTGNLHWPEEVDGFTPPPDLAHNIWFARDVSAMAAALGTEPVLIVLRDRSFDDPGVTALPVNTSEIPNDHLQYAITWFSLALIWATMTAYFLWRSRQTRKLT